MFSFFRHNIKPFHEGWFPVDGEHEIYYREFGNPSGRCVLLFHGGPGGCSKLKHALEYDLKKWRVILFDQRGCGRSRFVELLKDNTPQNAIKDAFDLLKYLKVKGKIAVGGGSYGASLALLFAETYPQRVDQLILNSVFLMRQKDINWVAQTSRLFYPDMWAILKECAGNLSVFQYFYNLASSGKYRDLQKVQKYYVGYEHMLGDLSPSYDKRVALTDSKVQEALIELHYEVNSFFLKEDFILKNIHKIASINTLIVHNRFDFCCPVYQAYDLAQKMTKAKLIIMPDKGHGSLALFRCLKKEISKL